MKSARKYESVLMMETAKGRRAIYYSQVFMNAGWMTDAKTLGLVKPFLKRWKTLASELLSERLKVLKLNHLSGLLSEISRAMALVTGLLLIRHALLHATGSSQSTSYDTNIFVLFLATFGRFAGLSSQLGQNVTWWIKEMTFIPYLPRFQSLEEEPKGKMRVPEQDLQVQLVNVKFRYPSMEDGNALDGMNLSFCKGEHIAIVGRMKSGKSTLFKMLMGFYQPDAGTILVNGVDLQNMDLDDWRKHVSCQPQGSRDYYDNLSELVRYGDLDGALHHERFQTAIKASGLDKVLIDLAENVGLKEEISTQPGFLDRIKIGNYFHDVKDKTVVPSGGQWQVISIARTLYKDADLYLLDEPTSHLDVFARTKLGTTLFEALKGRTVILISHDFSTVCNADRIVVLDQGRVAEDGSHADLMAKNGLYAEMFCQEIKKVFGVDDWREAKRYLEVIESIRRHPNGQTNRCN